MNKKGFTLIEVLSVIVLIGLIAGIATAGIMRGQTKAKERTLLTKVNNIEKAAILYAQDHREGFDSALSTDTGFCREISNCYYFNKNITVGDLITEGYIKGDNEGTDIENPTNKKSIKDCPIEIYQKYGKIYAVYLAKENPEDYDDSCWVQ